MIKALIKKQLRELLSMFIKRDKRKSSSNGGAILYGILLVYCVAVFFGIFYSMMNELCPAFIAVKMEWFYFAMAAIIATILAVVGSVFMAQSLLYNAKDNEFLLAMPIKPSVILFSRMVTLYIQNLLFEALVFIPAVIVYFRQAVFNMSALVFCVLLLFILPLLSLAITCILGWLVALVSSRMGNKSLITVVFSLAFLGVYFYFFSRLNQNIQSLIANSREIGEKVKGAVYPIYQMGQGAQGDAKGFIIFTLFTIVLFAIVYYTLSASFIKITTSKRGEKKTVYREKILKVSSLNHTLYKKESLHFLKSSIYMLNCGLGSVFLVIMAVSLMVKSDIILSSIETIPEIEGWIPIIGCLAVCFMVSTNNITSPSISLEGNNLWILQSMPVSGWSVMRGKLRLHMIVTAPAALFCSVVMSVVFKASIIMSVIIITGPLILLYFCGLAGLMFNLKFPKLNWNSEAVAVKQSLSVILTMFASWGILAVFAIIYVFSHKLIAVEIYASICIAIIAAASVFIRKWLKKRGVEIFESL